MAKHCISNVPKINLLLIKSAANKSIANSGAGRWSNRQYIAISSSLGSANKTRQKF